MLDMLKQARARQLESKKMSTICLPWGMDPIISSVYSHNWYSSRDHHAHFSKSKPQNQHRAKTAVFPFKFNDLSARRVCAHLCTHNHAKHPSFIKNLSTNLSTKFGSG